jgi:phosphatidylinositol alpha-1,6-mannosyltransferase
MIVPRCLSHLDLIFCVSRHGLEECRLRHIPVGKCRVVPNGIDPAEFELPPPGPSGLRETEHQAGIRLADRKILLSVTRLVPRKGVAWFVSEVMPRLDACYCYLIAGAGPDFRTIQGLIQHHGLADRVALLGRVPDAARQRLMAQADLFIMPNIRIPGDMEGFGIAALEAGSSGLPVIASNIEGLRDAVIDGVTGHLVEERNVQEYVDKSGARNSAAKPFARSSTKDSTGHTLRRAIMLFSLKPPERPTLGSLRVPPALARSRHP